MAISSGVSLSVMALTFFSRGVEGEVPAGSKSVETRTARMNAGTAMERLVMATSSKYKGSLWYPKRGRPCKGGKSGRGQTYLSSLSWSMGTFPFFNHDQ